MASAVFLAVTLTSSSTMYGHLSSPGYEKVLHVPVLCADFGSTVEAASASWPEALHEEHLEHEFERFDSELVAMVGV
jgi:hypothetical protein